MRNKGVTKDVSVSMSSKGLSAIGDESRIARGRPRYFSHEYGNTGFISAKVTRRGSRQAKSAKELSSAGGEIKELQGMEKGRRTETSRRASKKPTHIRQGKGWSEGKAANKEWSAAEGRHRFELRFDYTDKDSVGVLRTSR
jgi:hypothetical protein